MLKEIETIIFDLGGVLLNIAPDNTIEKFQKLGSDLTEETFQPQSGVTPFSLFETGHLTNEEFLASVKSEYKLGCSDEDIIDAWNSMILDMPAENISLLNELKEKYQIFLLSNTNEMHYDKFAQECDDTHGAEFSALFHREFLSFKMGLRKPNAEIFKALIAQTGITPERTLFIDDSRANVEIALSVGLQAYYLERGKPVSALFAS